MTVEDLPSPLAFACARALPSERPSAAVLRDSATALLELACVRMLSEAATRPESLPFTVESAMRLSLLEPVGAEGWLDLYASLEHSGMVELLDWPSELGAAAREALAASGASSVLEWLEQAVQAEVPRPDTAETVVLLAHCARALVGVPPWLVLATHVTQGGHEVEARRLVGTRWPEVVRVPVAEPVPEGPCFWDRASPPVPIPAWLARWDADEMVLRFQAGREGRRYLWRSRRRADDVLTTLEPPPGLPPYLREPTFATPAGAERFDPNAQTSAFVRAAEDKRGETSRMVTRVAAPQAQDPSPALPGSVLALRVVAGPDLLRWAEVKPGQPLVLGRQQDQATFPLHHHQVSRQHAEVRAEGGEVFLVDLGSTNGTQIYSPVPGLPARTLRLEKASLHPGDTIGVGPVLLRLEWLSRDRVARLEELARFREDEERRDPSTLLLKPQAVKDMLPERLRATFREGGPARGDEPRLLGLLCYVDRLAAIHAQFGEKAADRAFRDVARVLQYEVDAALDPTLATSAASWVRVGYGELLLPAVDLDEARLFAEAERLVSLVAAHPFEVPVERLTLTAAIVEKRPEEPAGEWLKRCRRVLQDGRSKHGRSRVYR